MAHTVKSTFNFHNYSNIRNCMDYVIDKVKLLKEKIFIQHYEYIK